MKSITIELASVLDCELLTQTAITSKQYWGYSDTLIEQWKDQLTITEESFANSTIFKCFNEGEYIGFFAVKEKKDYMQLDHLWLLPSHIKKGYGAQIMNRVKEYAHQRGSRYIEVYADPNSNGYYEKQGGQVIHQILTCVPGRMMNIYYLPVVDERWSPLATAGLIVIENGKLLLTYSNNKNAWYLPGGKVDPGENSKEVLIREIEEELSIRLDENRLTYLTHIAAPAYGEKLNIMMEQDCYLYQLDKEVLKASNEIGGIQYYALKEYKEEEIQVPGVLMVYEYLKYKGLL